MQMWRLCDCSKQLQVNKSRAAMINRLITNNLVIDHCNLLSLKQTASVSRLRYSIKV